MKKTRYPIMNMGTISILTIFIILCMVTFAALTYISTRRDASFTDRLASRTSGYYAAVSEANRQIAEIDSRLRQAWEDGTWADTEKNYTFSVSIDDDTELCVALTACSPEEGTAHTSVSDSFRKSPQKAGRERPPFRSCSPEKHST